MVAHPQRFLRNHPTRRALLRRPLWINREDVTVVLFAVVLERLDENTPPDLVFVPRVPTSFQHPFDVEVFEEHRVVGGGVEVREFVFEVILLVRHPLVHVCDADALVPPVVRPVVFPR